MVDQEPQEEQPAQPAEGTTGHIPASLAARRRIREQRLAAKKAAEERANAKHQQRQLEQQAVAIKNSSSSSNAQQLQPGPSELAGIQRPIPIRLQQQQQQPKQTLALGAVVPPNPYKKRRMKSVQSLARKYKPSWYHQVAAQNKLGSINENITTQGSFHNEQDDDDEEENQEEEEMIVPKPGLPSPPPPASLSSTQQAKQEVLRELNQTGGESNTPAFQVALEKLIQQYDSSHFNPRKPVPKYAKAVVGNQLEGIGISAGKPTFPGCIGHNEAGDPMYKLGLMSFDMFCPTQLICSVQGTFVLIDTIDGRNPNSVKNVPQHLLADVRFGRMPVRTYDIVTPFTIEAWKPEFGETSPNKGVEQPIHGVMKTYGFILPYPKGNRFSVWFTGGSLEVDDASNEKWFQIFDKDSAPKRTFVESGKLLAAKLLMGASTNTNMEMDEHGRLSYSLSRPQASHIDLIYLDKKLQVLRGSSGTVYVHVRLPGSKAVQDSMASDELLPAPIMDPMEFPPNGSSNDAIDQKSSSEPKKDEEASRLTMVEDIKQRYAACSRTRRSAGIRRVMSESDLVDESSTEDASGSSDARLQELDSFVVFTKKSCLKKSSSYGQLEDLGTNIPIRKDRDAWLALPKPKSQKLDSPKKKRRPRGFLKKLRRTFSDSHLFKGGPEKDKDEDLTAETNSTDSEEEEAKQPTEGSKPILRRSVSFSDYDAPSESKGTEEEEEATKGPETSLPKLRRSVSFSDLEIRTYNCTVGDNPCCRLGPSMSLDWTHSPQTEKRPLRSSDGISGHPTLLTAMERRQRLQEEFDVSATQIVRAQAAKVQVQKQRSFTNRNIYDPSAMEREMRVEEAMESIQRTAKKAVSLLKRKPTTQRPRKNGNGVAGVA